MPTIQHSALTTTDLHEPKGASTAANSTVYVANGAGSGDWKTVYNNGWEDWSDSGSSQSLTSGSYIDLTNNGSGPFTNSTYRLPGYSAIWSTANNQFTWASAGLSIGDSVDLRLSMVVTTTGSNHVVMAKLDMAHGDPAEYPIHFLDKLYKSAGTYKAHAFTSIYIGNAATLNNPAKVSMWTDNAGNSVVVEGWYAKVMPINPVYV